MTYKSTQGYTPTYVLVANQQYVGWSGSLKNAKEHAKKLIKRYSNVKSVDILKVVGRVS